MMKKFLFLAISIFIITSCNTDDDTPTETNFTGEWELVKTTSSIGDETKTGAEMEWQESYVLKADSTFTKTRVRDNKTSVAQGTFTINDNTEFYGLPAIASITMIYESENDIIATCYSDKLHEELYFDAKDVMISTYEQCDGLGLEYARILD
ncbi:hypothetical protein GCM10007103_22320 [Salinimicrobium marinum]|uniref:Lipocalin-like domain-containing protein n=2 Tax=Salinimicrobium marinum TaxID=680283 RepID=A0A918SHT2_9FLAO|nr:hypothetical protein GCM10007103_22320 [Salinimicrobium marinum]